MGSSERPLRRCALSSRVVNPSLLATKMHFAREPIVAKSDLDYSTLPWSSSRFLLCIKQSRPKQEPWGCFQTRIWIGDMCALCPHPIPSTRGSIIGQLTGCASQKYSRRALQVVPSWENMENMEKTGEHQLKCRALAVEEGWCWST